MFDNNHLKGKKVILHDMCLRDGMHAKREQISVDEMVTEFLTVNPHFVRASQGGAGSMGSAGGSTPKPQSVEWMVENWNSGGKEAYTAMKRKG